MTAEISNDRAGLPVLLLLRFHRMQNFPHTHLDTLTQTRHCPVTAASYFWNLSPQPRVQMPASSPPTAPINPLSPCVTITANQSLQSRSERKQSWQPTNQLITTLYCRTLTGLIVDMDAAFMAIYSVITAWLHKKQFDMRKAGWQGAHQAKRDSGSCCVCYYRGFNECIKGAFLKIGICCTIHWQMI